MRTEQTRDRVTCRTPTPGKKPTRIAKWKFDLLRRAILSVVPRRGEGVRFSDLPALVADKLKKDERADLGSLNWYTTTVKLELEVRGEIRRIPGSEPQRLVRS
jgi:hypothetical protein